MVSTIKNYTPESFTESSGVRNVARKSVPGSWTRVQI